MINSTVSNPRAPKAIFSNGAGKDSTAVMILQARGELSLNYTHVFCNVGAKSENPETLAYIEDVLKPYAQKHGIEFIEICKVDANGNSVDLWDYTLSSETKSIPIPFYLAGRAPAKRSCTVDWKVRVLNRWINSMNFDRVNLGIGFNLDEGYRMTRKPLFWHDHEMTYDKETREFKQGRALGFSQDYTFPLIRKGINRAHVESIIKSEGLVIPPKSACIFCPFITRGERIEQKRNLQVWNSALEFETALNEKIKRTKANPETAYIHPDKIPLAMTPDQMSLWDSWSDTEQAGCDEGYCGV